MDAKTEAISAAANLRDIDETRQSNSSQDAARIDCPFPRSDANEPFSGREYESDVALRQYTTVSNKITLM
jgi:hypothetical protein